MVDFYNKVFVTTLYDALLIMNTLCQPEAVTPQLGVHKTIPPVVYTSMDKNMISVDNTQQQQSATV